RAADGAAAAPATTPPDTSGALILGGSRAKPAERAAVDSQQSRLRQRSDVDSSQAPGLQVAPEESRLPCRLGCLRPRAEESKGAGRLREAGGADRRAGLLVPFCQVCRVGLHVGQTFEAKGLR